MKRFIPICLLFAMVGCSKDKTEIITYPQTEYDYVRKTDNNYRVTVKDGKQGLIDLKGKVILPPEYDFITVLDNKIICRKEKDMKILTLDGKEMLKNSYPYVYPIGENYLISSEDGKYGVIDANEKLIVEPQYDAIQKLNEGFYRVSKSGEYGLVNEKGQEVVKPKYKYIKEFANGMALVISDEGKGGFINTQGKEVVAPIYNYTEDYKGDITFVYDGKNFALIDKEGKDIKPFQANRLNLVAENIYSEKENEKFYLKDKDNNKISEVGYDSIGEEKEGLIPVRIDGKFGYINRKGEVVIPLVYSEIGEPNNGLIIAKDEGTGKFGVINYQNKYVVNPIYTYVLARNKEFFIVGDDNFREGVINAKGKIILPLEYSSLSFKYDNLVFGENEKGEYKYIFLKPNSSEVMNVNLEDVIDYDNDEIVVKTDFETKIYKIN